MSLVEPVSKVLTYITWGERVLVFRQPRRPEQGIQVPGGSVEPAEELVEAALREAFEETGLERLLVERFLGSARYELKVDAGPPHLRHFFHLSFGGHAPERWQRIEPRLAGARPAELFELWWEPLATARLDWEMDARLGELLKS